MSTYEAPRVREDALSRLRCAMTESDSRTLLRGARGEEKVRVGSAAACLVRVMPCPFFSPVENSD